MDDTPASPNIAPRTETNPPLAADTSESGNILIHAELVEAVPDLPFEFEEVIGDCDSDTADLCRDFVRTLLQSDRSAAEGRIISGQQLTYLKKILPHGTFQGSCSALGLTKQHCLKCIRAFRHFGSVRDAVQHLGVSIIDDLAAKNVPASVRGDVIYRLTRGEYLSPSIIRKKIADAKPKTAKGSRQDRRIVDPTKPPTAQLTGGLVERLVRHAGLASDLGGASKTVLLESVFATGHQRAAMPSPVVSNLSTAPAMAFGETGSELVDEAVFVNQSGADHAIAIICELGPESLIELGKALKNADDAVFMRSLREHCNEDAVRMYDTDAFLCNA